MSDERKAGRRNAASDQERINRIHALTKELAALAGELGAEDIEEAAEEAQQAAEGAKSLAIGGTKSVAPYRLKGHGLVYGGKDLVGDTFTKATDLGAGRSFVGMPVYYDHALGGVKSQVGHVVAYEFDDDGLVFEIELDKRRKYADIIMKLDAEKALGQSTGAPPHLTYRKSGEIMRWIVAEVSLTPTPCEPRTNTTNTAPIKAQPQGAGDAPAQAKRRIIIIN